MHVYMKWHNWKLLQSMPPGESMDMGKGYDDMISCAVDISVSASYSRYCYSVRMWTDLARVRVSRT